MTIDMTSAICDSRARIAESERRAVLRARIGSLPPVEPMPPFTPRRARPLTETVELRNAA